ncbi:MAG: hypothetical protein ACM3PY_16605 [Omnitrophica WOR_2 bacterium]
MESSQFDLGILPEYGCFQVSLEGETQEAFFTHKPAVYQEWIYGVKEPGGWIMTWQGFRSRNPVMVTTPLGKLTLRAYQIRLYTAPVYSRVFSVMDAGKAPEPVKRKILQENRPLTVEEYRLDPGKIYYACAEIGQYSLPPWPAESPRAASRNIILAISDLPFIDNRPQRPVTPSCLNLTY